MSSHSKAVSNQAARLTKLINLILAVVLVQALALLSFFVHSWKLLLTFAAQCHLLQTVESTCAAATMRW